MTELRAVDIVPPILTPIFRVPRLSISILYGSECVPTATATFYAKPGFRIGRRCPSMPMGLELTYSSQAHIIAPS